MLPPGPWHPAIFQTYRYVTEPLDYSRKVTARYGKTVRIRALNAKGVTTTDPTMIKLIFSADPDAYETMDFLTELFGPGAVVATSGPTHRRQRKLLNPRFHGPAMRLLLGTVQRAIETEFDTLETAQQQAAPVVFMELAQNLTLHVMLEAVLGESTDRDRIRRSHAVCKEVVDALRPTLFGAPIFRSKWNPQWRRFLAVRAAFNALVDTRLAEVEASGGTGADLLGAMAEGRYEDGTPMTPEELKDQLFSLLLAGHETTAVALAWAAYYLTVERDVCDRLRTEVAGVDADNLEAICKLPYLDAVCCEAIRIQPSITEVARVCKKPLALGSYTVPAGEIVVVNTGLLHRSEDLYPDPLRFRPERFLERKYSAFEYAPFGGGQRRCLGSAFAEAELRLAVATLVRDWEFALGEGPPETAVRRNITMGPKNGVRLRVVGRRTRGSESAALERRSIHRTG